MAVKKRKTQSKADPKPWSKHVTEMGKQHSMKPQVKHHPDDVINNLIHWGEQQDRIRAMLMTSTRAVPNAPVDELSDYDVVLVVKDIHPFYEERSWLNDFGEVLVAYWDPIYADPDTETDKFGNVIQYGDGLKIDFTLYPLSWLRSIVQASALPAELDAGYRILLDKDDLTRGLKQPTYSAYILTVPSDEAYQKWIHEFFSDAPYAAKCLIRGELLPLKWCLDYDMKHGYLRQMLEWKIGLDDNGSVPVGLLGKGLKKHLSIEIWSQLEECYAGANVDENWQALYHTMTLFRRVAVDVGQRLGYVYPLDLDQRVTAFVKSMQR
jgi:aminoglycoside 6-adenylyltransferase